MSVCCAHTAPPQRPREVFSLGKPAGAEGFLSETKLSGKWNVYGLESALGKRWGVRQEVKAEAVGVHSPGLGKSPVPIPALPPSQIPKNHLGYQTDQTESS